MEFVIKGFHIIVSLVLIFVVLLQSGKGASMGATFGGSSSNALFGATGSNNFMTKLTTFVAVLFIITCLTLAYMSSHMATSSLMNDVEAETPAESMPMPEKAPMGEALPMEDANAEVPSDQPAMPASEAPADTRLP